MPAHAAADLVKSMDAAEHRERGGPVEGALLPFCARPCRRRMTGPPPKSDASPTASSLLQPEPSRRLRDSRSWTAAPQTRPSKASSCTSRNRPSSSWNRARGAKCGVFESANRHGLAILAHIARHADPPYGTRHAAVFANQLAAAAPDVAAVMAHLWGGGNCSDDAMATYADAIASVRTNRYSETSGPSSTPSAPPRSCNKSPPGGFSSPTFAKICVINVLPSVGTGRSSRKLLDLELMADR